MTDPIFHINLLDVLVPAIVVGLCMLVSALYGAAKLAGLALDAWAHRWRRATALMPGGVSVSVRVRLIPGSGWRSSHRRWEPKDEQAAARARRIELADGTVVKEHGLWR